MYQSAHLGPRQQGEEWSCNHEIFPKCQAMGKEWNSIEIRKGHLDRDRRIHLQREWSLLLVQNCIIPSGVEG